MSYAKSQAIMVWAFLAFDLACGLATASKAGAFITEALSHIALIALK